MEGGWMGDGEMGNGNQHSPHAHNIQNRHSKMNYSHQQYYYVGREREYNSNQHYYGREREYNSNQHYYDHSQNHNVRKNKYFSNIPCYGDRKNINNVSLPYYKNKQCKLNEHGDGNGDHYQIPSEGKNLNRNNQFLSRHIPDHSDQSPRSKNSINTYLHNKHGEAKTHSHGDHSGRGQLHQFHNKYKPGHRCQSLSGNHGYVGREEVRPTTSGEVRHTESEPTTTTEERKQDLTYETTPTRKEVKAPKIRLFDIQREEDSNDDYHLTEVIPINTDLEVLLINSCKIDATKVQTIVNDLMMEKGHSTIFCMTETKVEGHDFQPMGIKIFSKHRVYQ